MSSLEETWYLLKKTVGQCCCCKSRNKTNSGHRRFSDTTQSFYIGQNNIPHTKSTENTVNGGEGMNYIIPTNGIVNPAYQEKENNNDLPPLPPDPLENNKRKKHKKGFKLNFDKIINYVHPDRHRNQYVFDEDQKTSSISSNMESGYGHSIEEEQSLHSCAQNMNISVLEMASEKMYKIQVQDNSKCWVLKKSQVDFIEIQSYIKREKGSVGPVVPVNDKAQVQDLEYFLLNVISDDIVTRLSKVRKFLSLDDFSSYTRSASVHSSKAKTRSDVAEIPPAKPHPSKSTLRPVVVNQYGNLILNARNLPKKFEARPPPIPPRPVLQISKKSTSNTNRRSSSTSEIPTIGCEVKRSSPSDFEFLSLIGKGSFGKVIMARKKDDDKIYAVKILNKRMIFKRNETAHVMSERSVLTRVLEHPYLVQLHFAFTTKNKIFFVMDYVNGGELFYHLQQVRTFSESRTRFYAAEICCALIYMHSKGIIYRDLKPENILLDREGHVVLTDFGLCKEGLETEDSKTMTFCGTPEYLAPEIILKLPYTRSVDWWTFGAVIYEMTHGLPPFYSKDTTFMYHAIVKKPIRLKNSTSLSIRDILLKLLNKNPERRLGCGPHDGIEVQAHQFFESINWEKIEMRQVKPPFIPHVNGDDDISNIDPQFTKEKIAMSRDSSRRGSSLLDRNNPFRGFSYVKPKNIDANKIKNIDNTQED